MKSLEDIDLTVLVGEQRAVILLYYALGWTESAVAAELSELFDRPYDRDRVHSIRLAAERALRRTAKELVAV